MYFIGEIPRQKRIQANGLIVVHSSPGIPWKSTNRLYIWNAFLYNLQSLHSLKKRQQFLEWNLLLREGQKEDCPLGARSHPLKFPTCGISKSFERRALDRGCCQKVCLLLKTILGKCFLRVSTQRTAAVVQDEPECDSVIYVALVLEVWKVQDWGCHKVVHHGSTGILWW